MWDRSDMSFYGKRRPHTALSQLGSRCPQLRAAPPLSPSLMRNRLRCFEERRLTGSAAFPLMPLKVEAELHGHGSRCDVVRAAEGGNKVIERFLVGQIDDRKLEAPLTFVAVEEVIVTHG